MGAMTRDQTRLLVKLLSDPEFRVFGYTLDELHEAIQFAELRGWVCGKVDSTVVNQEVPHDSSRSLT
jgi:hypothetical protein